MDKNIPVCGFLHAEPEIIPTGKSENDPDLVKKLDDFRHRVAEGRLVKFWKSAEELPGMVVLALTQSFKRFPRPGWVRGNAAATIELYSELEKLRKENNILLEKTKNNGLHFTNQSIRIFFYYMNEVEEFNKVEIEKELLISDISEFIPTGFIERNFTKSELASIIIEEMFGLEKFMEIEMTSKSLDDLFFVLSELNLVRNDYPGYSFSQKMKRIKLKYDFGIDP